MSPLVLLVMENKPEKEDWHKTYKPHRYAGWSPFGFMYLLCEPNIPVGVAQLDFFVKAKIPGIR